jgi:hypothetical protein
MTAFCFGVPVAGIVIREITRRASQQAEQRTAARAITSQLDYLDRIVERLSPGPIQSASDRLRKLAETAWSAMPHSSTSAREMEASGKISAVVISVEARVGRLAMRPDMEKAATTELQLVIRSNELWGSVGFSCGRLGDDLARLMSILYPPTESHQTFPSWLDELTSALQTLLVFQLPVQRLWLLAAANEESVPVEAWSLHKETSLLKETSPSTEKAGKEKLMQDILGIGGSAKVVPYSVTPELISSAQERATNELRGELFALGHHLEALATLVKAARKCRSELKPVEGQ